MLLSIVFTGCGRGGRIRKDSGGSVYRKREKRDIMMRLTEENYGKF